MPTDNSAMIRQQARIFDDVRPKGARLFLIKKAGETKKFTAVAEITSGWYVIFDKDFRDEIEVSIATLTDITDQIAQSSFVAYGFAIGDEEFDVFSFEKKDAYRPSATSPSWKIHAHREAELRFSAFVKPVTSPGNPGDGGTP